MRADEQPIRPTQPARPLSGLRVVEFATAMSAPVATALLGDQGADVIKVERPGLGDLARYIGVGVNGMSAIFVQSNRGKRSIALDLAVAEGRDIALALCRAADVVVENFRSGVMDRLGLGYTDVQAVNSDIIYASVTGYGSVGPYRERSAYDLAIQAYAGLAATQADPADGRPVLIRQTAADKITALSVAQAITAALLARARGAGGQRVEVSMMDAVTSFVWLDSAGNEVLLDADGTSPSTLMGGFAPFPVRDGWAVVAPVSDADFAGLCAAFDVAHLIDEHTATIAARFLNPEKTMAVLDECFRRAARMSQHEVSAVLDAHRVPFALVLAPSQLAADPHAIEVALFERNDHPVAGQVRMPRHPIRFATTPAQLGGSAPRLGEHTAEVLAELDLVSDTEALRKRGVIT